MKPADLRILVQEGEGTTIEFKESIPANLARDLVALANTIGGKILLGVRDDGTVVGAKDSNALRARVQDIARNCDPPVAVRVEPVGKALVVHVRESDAKPVQCSEGFFWRQGAVTQKLSRDEIREFFRAEGAIRFDLSPCPRFRYPQDFDRDRYNTWLRLSGITGRPRTEDVLVNIEAAERAGGKLLFRNAGVLFFEKAGTGVKRIRDEARDGGYPEPVWEANGFTTAIFRPNPEVRAAAEAQSGAQSRQVLAALARGERSAGELAKAVGLRSKTGALKRTLGELVTTGLVEYTLPEKPASRLQHYRLTEAGRALLKTRNADR